MSHDSDLAQHRLRLLQVGFFILAALLVSRLAQLQLINSETLVARAQATRRHVRWLPAVRGSILDRRGTPLASSRPVYDVVAAPVAVDPLVRLAASLAWAMRRRSDTADDRCHRERDIYQRLLAGEQPLQVEVGPVATGQLIKLARRNDLTVAVAAPESSRHDPDIAVDLEATAAAATVLIHVSEETLSASRHTVEHLASLLACESEAIDQSLAKSVGHGHAAAQPGERRARLRQRRPLARDVGFDAAARVEEALARDQLAGVHLEVRAVRCWPLGALTGHLVGRTAKLNASEVATLRSQGQILDRSSAAPRPLPADLSATARTLLRQVKARAPLQGDRLFDDPKGRSGLESRLDQRLKGTPGLRVVERDAFGRDHGALLEIPPHDGTDVRLTLDVELQETAVAALDEACSEWSTPGSGAAAAFIDIRDGAIRVLASAPRYDPNHFSHRYGDLVTDPAKPLLHRAVGSYPPGSTWKPLVGLAASGYQIGESLFDPDATITCRGRYSETARSFSCWNRSGHGPMNLRQAIEGSCNIYFIKLAERLGPQPILALARRLGFGASPAIPVTGARTGNLPDPDSGPWWPGNTRNLGIGQGSLLASPLQIAQLAAAVARGNLPLPLRLVTDATPPLAAGLESTSTTFNPRVLEAVRRGMFGAAHTPHRGTASAPDVGLKELDVAVKTGTAELGRGRQHAAWIMGYWPATAPRLAFAVVVERTAGHGGHVAGPVVSKVLHHLLSQEGDR